MAFCVFRALGCSREEAVRTVNEMIGAVPVLAKLAGRKWTGKASPSDMLWIEILRRDALGGATAGEAKPTKCATCDGRGALSYYEGGVPVVECGACGGTGEARP